MRSPAAAVPAPALPRFFSAISAVANAPAAMKPFSAMPPPLALTARIPFSPCELDADRKPRGSGCGVGLARETRARDQRPACQHMQCPAADILMVLVDRQFHRDLDQRGKKGRKAGRRRIDAFDAHRHGGLAVARRHMGLRRQRDTGGIESDLDLCIDGGAAEQRHALGQVEARVADRQSFPRRRVAGQHDRLAADRCGRRRGLRAHVDEKAVRQFQTEAARSQHYGRRIEGELDHAVRLFDRRPEAHGCLRALSALDHECERRAHHLDLARGRGQPLLAAGHAVVDRRRESTSCAVSHQVSEASGRSYLSEVEGKIEAVRAKCKSKRQRGTKWREREIEKQRMHGTAQLRIAAVGSVDRTANGAGINFESAKERVDLRR